MKQLLRNDFLEVKGKEEIENLNLELSVSATKLQFGKKNQLDSFRKEVLSFIISFSISTNIYNSCKGDKYKTENLGKSP